MKGKVLKGTLWFSSGTLVRAALRILVISVLARLLVPEDFGLVGAAGIFIALAELFSTSGMVYVVVQRTELEQRHVRTAFTWNLLAGVAAGVAVWVLSGLIADFFNMPRLEPILSVLALLFPLNAMSSVSQKLLERELAYGRLAAVEVASYVVGYAMVAVPLALLGYGVWSLVFAQLGASAVRSALLVYSQPHKLRLSADFRTYSEMMRTGAGYSLVRYALYVAHKGDYFVVGRWLGAAPLGLYERAYVLMDLSNTLLASALQTVLFPAFAKLQTDKQALALAFERVSALLGLVFLPVGVVASLLAPEIIAVLLGGQWSAAVDPFRILALGMVFRTGFKISVILANGVGAPYRNAGALVVYAIVVVAGALVAVPYGITAVAAATLFALLVVFILLTQLSLVLTGLSWGRLFRAYVPAICLTLVAGAATLIATELLRRADSPPFVTLAVTGIVLAAVVVLLLRFAPGFFGANGRWAIDTLCQSFPVLKRIR